MSSGRGGRELVVLYGVWSLIYWSLVSQGSFCEHLSCHFLCWSCKHLIWKVNYLPGCTVINSQAVLWVARDIALFPVIFFQHIVNSTSMTNLHSLSQLQNTSFFLHVRLCAMVLEHPVPDSNPKDISTSSPTGSNQTRHQVFAQLRKQIFVHI